MKNFYLVIALISASVNAQSVFINEIHYDNMGIDTNEGVEIAGPAGTDLSTYSLVLYNGSSTQLRMYETIQLNGIIANQDGGLGTLSFAAPDIQNGPPDGIALANGSTLIQFLSYEGSFVPIDGVAQGVESENIGVEESNNTTEVGHSLQLSGTGSVYSDFTWQEPAIASQGSVNNGQTFDDTVLSNFEFTALENETILYPNPSTTGEVTLQTPLSSEVEVSIYNSLGATVTTQTVSNNQAVSTKELATGIYFVQLTVDGNTTTKRIVVQ